MRNRERQLPACSSARDSFVITLRTPQPSEEDQALRPSRSRASACRCARGSPLYPRGPWLRHEFCCLAPSSLTPTPSASPTGTRQLHGLAGYMPRLRCAGAPRRPAGPSLLSLPCCPDVPSTIRRWVQGAVPLLVRTPVPGFLALSPSRHPQEPASASNIRRGVLHDAASFASCCGPSACQDLLTGSDPMASRVRHPAFCGLLSLPLGARPVTDPRWESG